MEPSIMATILNVTFMENINIYVKEKHLPDFHLHHDRNRNQNPVTNKSSRRRPSPDLSRKPKKK